MMALFSRSLRNLTKAGVNVRLGTAVASYHKNVSLRFTCLFLNPWVCFGVAHVLLRLLWEFDWRPLPIFLHGSGIFAVHKFLQCALQVTSFFSWFWRGSIGIKSCDSQHWTESYICSWQYLGPSSYYIVSLLYLAKVMRNTARPTEISSSKKC